MYKKMIGFFLLQGVLISYEYSITICSVFKNEAPWLKEWIEYHKMIGVEHFRLYNNDSTDDYLAVLIPYMERGEVEVIDWPNQEGDLVNWAYLRQWPACVDGIVHLSGVSKWVTLIDIDEFILPLECTDLQTFLMEYEDYPGVLMNWQCFGTSFVEEIPVGQLMIEALTMKAQEYSEWNKPVKSIVRPERVDVKNRGWAPHVLYYLNDEKSVYPDKVKREKIIYEKLHPCKIVVNHYVHRTEQFFWEEKMAKKQKMENWTCLKDPYYVAKWYLECNEVEDKRIFPFIPELKKRMNRENE